MPLMVVSDLHEDYDASRCMFNSLSDLCCNRLVLLGDIADYWAFGNSRAEEFWTWMLGNLSRLPDLKDVDIVVGNHDAETWLLKDTLLFKKKPTRIVDYLVLRGNLFIHGHQADLDTYNPKTTRFLKMATWMYAKYLQARVPEIQHISEEIAMAILNRRKHTNEKDKYRNFAHELAIDSDSRAVFMGHTHDYDVLEFEEGAMYYNSGFGLDRECIIVDEEDGIHFREM